MSFIFNPMKMGLTGLYMPRFDVDHWFDVFERDKPMMIFLVPAMAELITASPRFEGADLSAPTAVSIGSAPLAPATLEAPGQMPQASVINSYGLTEAGPAFITMPKEEAAKRIGSVGKPMPPMEVKVVDPDTDDLRQANEVGELLVRLPGQAPRVLQGRRREPGRMDRRRLAAHRRPRVPRRRRLRLHLGPHQGHDHPRGNNIYATDVEAVILEHPDVQEAAVIGVPHQVLGEDVGAFVVCKPGVNLDDEELIEFCAERLADYKRPRRLWFVPELPRNATGKVMKHKLREDIGR